MNTAFTMCCTRQCLWGRFTELICTPGRLWMETRCSLLVGDESFKSTTRARNSSENANICMFGCSICSSGIIRIIDFRILQNINGGKQRYTDRVGLSLSFRLVAFSNLINCCVKHTAFIRRCTCKSLAQYFYITQVDHLNANIN